MACRDLVLGARCSVLGAVDSAACGNQTSTFVHATLTTTSPTFYVSTPATAKTGNSGCETEFELTWRWANLTRASQDTLAPPLSNLSHAFQADGGLSYFPYTETPTYSSANNYWVLTHSDHDANDGDTTVFSILTSLLSTAAAADSIAVQGTITYYY
jgi:hypothetical protein